jgi:hypothetical protein
MTHRINGGEEDGNKKGKRTRRKSKTKGREETQKMQERKKVFSGNTM